MQTPWRSILKMMVLTVAAARAEGLESLEDVVENARLAGYQTQAQLYHARSSTFSSWVPSAAKDVDLPTQCGSEKLRTYLKAAQGTYDFSQRVRNYFRACEKTLSRNAPKSQAMAFVRSASIRYNYLNRPEFKELTFKTPEGLKIRYHLAVKRDGKAWPLVVLKCGILCNLDAGSLAKYAMMLFDEGPFNVVLVPSVTGNQFIKDNKIFMIGGVEEGRQLHYLVKHLTEESSYRKKFSSVHVMAGSLGGNASLFLGLYNTYSQGPVRSILSGCSVVDFEKSFKKLFEKKTFISYMLYRRIADQVATESVEIPAVGQILQKLSIKKLLFALLPDFIAQVATNYYSEVARSTKWALKPFDQIPLSTTENVLNAHRFQNYAQNVRTPIYLWSGEHDAVVNTKINLGALNGLSNVDRREAFLQTTTTSLGGHCEFDQYYSWAVTATILRSYFEMHSPELRSRSHSTRVSLPTLKTSWFYRAPNRNEKTVGLEWKVSSQSDTVELIERVQSANQFNGKQAVMPGPHHRQVKYKVPFATFAKVLGWKLAQSEAEAEAFTRYLNAQTEMLTAEGQAAQRSTEISQVEIRYFR